MKLSLVAAGAKPVVHRGRGPWSRILARDGTALLAAGGFAGLVVASIGDGGEIDLPWAPTLGLRLAFRLDGLAILYGLLATGIGLAVVLYSRTYLPAHLAHQGRSRDDEVRFYGLLALFMASMVGLAAAQDLILIFLFWDLTAVASYFLIGYDRQDEKDRQAALTALLVTGVTAVLLLVAALMLRDEYGTTDVWELFAGLEPTSRTVVSAGLVAVAALAKSAQAPLHFWLPRAMAAPTPVSAYLHSAALVAAGVFLLGRFYPLLRESPDLLNALLAVGLASTATGGVLALTRDGLKQVLAYSTVAQYGFVVFLLGLGTRDGVVAASFYVVVHALAKSALFLTAGAVTITTGENRLDRVGGLGRSMPGLAAASAVAAAALVSLPLTAGFFADELLFAAARERGPLAAVAVVAGATLTFAYMTRFWLGIFAGRPVGRAPRPARGLVVPVGALAAILLVTGVVPRPLAHLAVDAANPSIAGPGIEVAYHLARWETVFALAVYAVGATLLVLRRFWWAAALAAARLGARAGPDALYRLGLARLNALSDRMHGMEVRDLRTRIAAVLVPAGALVLLGVIETPTGGAYRIGGIGADDLGLALALGAAALAALAVTVPRHHITLVLVLSAVGFALAVAYAFFGAPNVALVAVLVETMLAGLFVGVLALLPRRVLRRESRLRASGSRRWRDPLVGVIAGLTVFTVAWGALSRPRPADPVATDLVGRSDAAHAENVVTAILVDFRGLDTLGEITVLAVALVGLAVLLRRGRLRS